MRAKPTVTANNLSQIHCKGFAQLNYIFTGMEFSVEKDFAGGLGSRLC
jgi:hypothetical protein